MESHRQIIWKKSMHYTYMQEQSDNKDTVIGIVCDYT